MTARLVRAAELCPGSDVTMLEGLYQPIRSAMGLPFCPVDIEAQSRSYRLKQRGTEDGAQNDPPTDASWPAQSEQAIIGAINAQRDKCLLDLSSHLRAEREALAQLQTAMDVAGMRHDADKAVSEFDALKVRYASTLRDRREIADAAGEEYANFRKRNRITWMARQPTGRIHTIVLVAFFIIFEAFANAYFFSGASEDGLLGGVVMAAAFSAVNIMIGVLNGWFPFRWAHHRNPALKLIGIAMAFSLCAGSLFLNIFVAHFRDVSAATGLSPPLPEIFIAVTHDPFGLEGVQSWFLLGLGALFAGIAIAKGYGLDDPYPLYGSVDRRRVAARNAYEEIRQSVMDDASLVRDGFTNELRVTIESLRASSTQRQQIIATRARNMTEFDAHESHLANAAQQLLSIYRRANTQARSTPPPSHFAGRFAFKERGLDKPEIRALREDQGLEINADQLIRELDALRKTVLDKYEALMREKWTEQCP